MADPDRRRAGPPRRTPAHGTRARYVARHDACHDECCRRAHRDYMRLWRAGGAVQLTFPADAYEWIGTR